MSNMTHRHGTQPPPAPMSTSAMSGDSGYQSAVGAPWSSNSQLAVDKRYSSHHAPSHLPPVVHNTCYISNSVTRTASATKRPYYRHDVKVNEEGGVHRNKVYHTSREIYSPNSFNPYNPSIPMSPNNRASMLASNSTNPFSPMFQGDHPRNFGHPPVVEPDPHITMVIPGRHSDSSYLHPPFLLKFPEQGPGSVELSIDVGDERHRRRTTYYNTSKHNVLVRKSSFSRDTALRTKRSHGRELNTEEEDAAWDFVEHVKECLICADLAVRKQRKHNLCSTGKSVSEEVVRVLEISPDGEVRSRSDNRPVRLGQQFRSIEGFLESIYRRDRSASRSQVCSSSDDSESEAGSDCSRIVQVDRSIDGRRHRSKTHKLATVHLLRRENNPNYRSGDATEKDDVYHHETEYQSRIRPKERQPGLVIHAQATSVLPGDDWPYVSSNKYDENLARIRQKGSARYGERTREGQRRTQRFGGNQEVVVQRNLNRNISNKFPKTDSEASPPIPTDLGTNTSESDEDHVPEKDTPLQSVEADFADLKTPTTPALPPESWDVPSRFHSGASRTSVPNENNTSDIERPDQSDRQDCESIPGDMEIMLSSALTKTKDVLLKSLMSYVENEVLDACDESNDHKRARESSSMSSQLSDQPRRKRTKGNGRNPGDDDNDNSDDDSGEDEENRRPGKGDKTGPSGIPPRRLKCPFYQRQPEKHSRASCRGGGFADIAKLKDHIKRVHTQPMRCFRCWADMKNDDEFANHLRETNCKTLPEPKDDRIPHRLLKNIDFKKAPYARAKNTEEKWEILYSVLFPDDEQIPSAYDQHYFNPKLERVLYEAIEEELTKELAAELRPLLQRIKKRIPAIIQRCKLKLCRGEGSLVTDEMCTPSSLSTSDQVSIEPIHVRQEFNSPIGTGLHRANITSDLMTVSQLDKGKGPAHDRLSPSISSSDGFQYSRHVSSPGSVFDRQVTPLSSYRNEYAVGSQLPLSDSDTPQEFWDRAHFEPDSTVDQRFLVGDSAEKLLRVVDTGTYESEPACALFDDMTTIDNDLTWPQELITNIAPKSQLFADQQQFDFENPMEDLGLDQLFN